MARPAAQPDAQTSTLRIWDRVFAEVAAIARARKRSFLATFKAALIPPYLPMRESPRAEYAICRTAGAAPPRASYPVLQVGCPRLIHGCGKIPWIKWITVP